MTAKIAAELNRERVRKSQENSDRLNLYLPKGTLERIRSLGFRSTNFARELILAELEKLERIKK